MVKYLKCSPRFAIPINLMSLKGFSLFTFTIHSITLVLQDVYFKKSLGQHFLKDENIILRIISALKEQSVQ